jgi:hypothetical protein
LEAPAARGVLTNRSILALGVIALVLIASIALYSSYYSGVAAGSRSNTVQATSTAASSQQSQSSSSFQSLTSSKSVSPNFGRGNFSSSADSIDGLRLALAIEATAIPLYGTLSVRVEEQNTLPQPANVTAADDWRLIVSPSVGCGGADVVGIALFAGNYTNDDLPSSGQLSPHSGSEVCLLDYGLPNVYSYDFQPHSASATEAYGCEANSTGNGAGSSPCGCEMEACPPYLMTERAQTQANFSVDAQTGDYHYLSPGVYTLVGADEWGTIAILHFVVASPGCPLPQSENGSKLPFANEQTSVNGTWTFGFGLNSTFVLGTQGLRATASLIDSNLTYESQHPLLLYGRPFLASMQFISPNGTVAWSYPPANRTSLADLGLNGAWPGGEWLDITNGTMSMLQGNQTYTVVAKPMIFSPFTEQPISVGVEITMSLTVC